MTVTGTGFRSGATVSVLGAGVVVHDVAVTTSTQLSLDVSVDAGAALGLRAVTVTNSDGSTVTKANAFQVSAPPTISGLSNSRLRRGQTMTVQVLGSAFAANFVAQGGEVGFGAGLDVTSVTRNSASKLTATVVIAPDAAPGARSVTVTNPDGGTTTCAGCATVVVDPVVAALSPDALGQGATRTVTVSGNGFAAGASVKVSGSGITVVSVSVDAADTLSVVVRASASAAPGPRDLTVTNPDTGTATCAGCLLLAARPTVSGLTPSTAARNATTLVSVNGTGLQPGLTVTFSGAGVSAEVQTVSPTAAVVRVTVAPTAPTGYRTVTVVNPDGGSGTRGTALRIT